MGNFCTDCKFWEKDIIPRCGDTLGLCHSPAVEFAVSIDGSKVVGDYGKIWTAKFFGCIHFRESDGTIIDFGDMDIGYGDKDEDEQ